ncbi:AfsR/SARP family transcriptional regulator [Streptomyces sp. NPDC088560]|uniref:AfsR/SARP family transcriptional regulator n=1 Tax=Streptomyces sp. NPDC088560 TaxID=3365868 RepID=UPI0037F1A15D
MRFSVLGSVKAWSDDREIRLGSPQQRAVLAALLLKRGKTVGVDELISAVWGDDRPSGSVPVIRTYISRLRRVLKDECVEDSSPEIIQSVANGYTVHVSDHMLDLAVVEACALKAKSLAEAADLVGVLSQLHQALQHWEGTPLDGVPGPLAQMERSRLQERRMCLVVAKLAFDLALGRHTEVLGELTELHGQYPLREELSELLMIALHQSDRSQEALTVYQTTHRILVEELGIEPGPSLRGLYETLDTTKLGPFDLTALAERARALVGARAMKHPGEEVGNRQSSGCPTRHAVDESLGRESDDACLSVPPATRVNTGPRPSQLPPTVPFFVGREEQLRELDDTYAKSGRPACIVVSGMAGVGKTTLAVRWAGALAQDFPDGYLFVDLRGFNATAALAPAVAAQTILEALGFEPGDVPAEPIARLALYRSLLADQRLLLILDNARDSDQVEPLLPGTSKSLVIVTSRKQLPSIVARHGTHPISVTPLNQREAEEFLTKRVGTDRVSSDWPSAQRIVQLCDGLPLALSIASARVSLNQNFTLHDIANGLAEEGDSLDAFNEVDGGIDLRSVFSWSYRDLPDTAAHLFRVLSLHPGPDITPSAAAALAGLPVRQTRSLLTVLARVHLLIEAEPGRFHFHNLVRAYARELAVETIPAGELDLAQTRFFSFLLNAAHQASKILIPNWELTTLEEPDVDSYAERLENRGAALRWLRRERKVLCSAVDSAARSAFPDFSWKIASLLDLLFDRAGFWNDALCNSRIALQAAQQSGDKPGQALAHRGIGMSCIRLERLLDAHAHLEAARVLYEELSDSFGLARTLRHMAVAENANGCHDRARRHYGEAYSIYRQKGDEGAQAAVLNESGWTSIMMGEHAEAIDKCERSADLYRKLGDSRGEAAAHDNLGRARHHREEFGLALKCYEKALGIYRDLRERALEADTMSRLGEAQNALGDLARAKTSLAGALAILEEEGIPGAAKVAELLRNLQSVTTGANTVTVETAIGEVA